MKKLGKQVIFDNLKEIVDPEHTALVLWDCQNGLVDNIFNREEFLEKLGVLLAAARGRNIPVVYTLITPLPAGYQSAYRTYQTMKRFNIDDPAKLPVFMKPGSLEAEVTASLAPVEDEVVLNKHSASIFFGTVFEQLMRSRGINTIVFTGIATEYGIEHSARDAGIRDFYPVVVSDCVSSGDKEMHEMALKVMQRLCLVVPSKEILEEWA
jgi:nicotinamidase-related amidase